MLATEEDWAALARFKNGEAAGFDALFQRHRTRVFNLILRVLKERAASEDITQDVFLKIYEKRGLPEPRGKFTTWLYRVAVNAALDAVRKRRFTRLFVPISEKENPALASHAPGAADLADSAELRARLEAEIARLPEALRIALHLSVFEELPQAEVAAILGISPKAVERRLHRARALLRRKL